MPASILPISGHPTTTPTLPTAASSTLPQHAASAPSPAPPTNSLVLQQDADWLKLLDTAHKGYISRVDVHRLIWSIGFNPTEEELIPVFAELNRPPSASPPPTRELTALLNSYDVSYESAHELFNHYLRNQLPFRPDAFKFATIRQVFWHSALRTHSPPYSYFGFPARFIPRYTPYEIGVSDIVKVFMTFTAVVGIWMTLVPLSLMKAAKVLKELTLLDVVTITVFSELAWTFPVAGRESLTLGIEQV